MESLTDTEINVQPRFYAYAGFWRRFAATMIDGLVLGGIAAIIGFGIGFVWATQGNGDDELSQNILSAIVNLAMLVISWFYYAVQESSETEATVGKRIMGIFVTDMQGAQLSFGRASARFFAKGLSTLTVIGYFLVGFTHKKQTLHDLIAGTLVIHAYS